MSFLCIGIAHMDERIHPEAPLERDSSIPAQLLRSPGGVMRNTAIAMARLGLDIDFLSLAGADDDGQAIKQDCAAAGMQVDRFLLDNTLSTGRYMALLDHDGSLAQGIVIEGAAPLMTPDWLARQLDGYHGKASVIADVNLPEDSLQWLAHWCHRHGRHLSIISVSPIKVRRIAGILPHLHQVFLSNSEALSLLDCLGVDVNRPEDAAMVLAEHGVNEVLLTCGKDGAILAKAGHLHMIDVPPTDIVDVTGAGDMTAAGYIFARHQQKEAQDCLLHAMAAARLALASKDAVPTDVTAQKLQNEIQRITETTRP